MALTKNKIKEILSKAGVASDKMDEAVDELMDGHVTSINALREERDGYKADAEKLPSVQKELDDLKKTVADGGDYEKKFNDEHTAFENFKAQVQKEKDTATKKNLYRDVLKELKVDEKRFDAIMKVTNFDDMKLTKDGKLDGLDKMKDGIKSEWADFIVTEKTAGAKVETPPAGSKAEGQGVSRAAQLMQQYNANRYGVAKSEKES